LRMAESELPLARGQLLEVEGVTARDGHSTYVDGPSLKVLENGAMPEAQVVAVKELTTGSKDGQFVEVGGVVTAVDSLNGRALLHVHCDQEQVNVILGDSSTGTTNLRQLVDAEVRIRGVCSAVTDSRRKLLHAHLLVRKLEDITIERAASATPYARPATPINQVGLTNGGHRVKVSGMVREIVPKAKLVLKDDTGQIVVRTDEQMTAWPGDQIEVLGFPIAEKEGLVLDHSLFRSIAPQAAQHPSVTNRLDLPPPPYLPLLQRIADVRALPPE